MRLLIAKNWRMPTVHEWRLKCLYCMLMSKLTAYKNMKNGSIYATKYQQLVWSGYLKYWNTLRPDYRFEEEILDVW